MADLNTFDDRTTDYTIYWAEASLMEFPLAFLVLLGLAAEAAGGPSAPTGFNAGFN